MERYTLPAKSRSRRSPMARKTGLKSGNSSSGYRGPQFLSPLAFACLSLPAIFFTGSSNGINLEPGGAARSTWLSFLEYFFPSGFFAASAWGIKFKMLKDLLKWYPYASASRLCSVTAMAAVLLLKDAEIGGWVQQCCSSLYPTSCCSSRSGGKRFRRDSPRKVKMLREAKS